MVKPQGKVRLGGAAPQPPTRSKCLESHLSPPTIGLGLILDLSPPLIAENRTSGSFRGLCEN